MSDYNFGVSILRGQMADELAGNMEQFAWVLTNALSGVDANDIIDCGDLGDETDADLVVQNLRLIADAIETGKLT